MRPFPFLIRSLTESKRGPPPFLERNYEMGAEDEAYLLCVYPVACVITIKKLEHNKKIIAVVLHFRALVCVQDIFHH